uniref:Uncharacterized protein n=1 Tax=Arundo donax TaxID=35708 RepID=A0A0A9A3T9_ARUDO
MSHINMQFNYIVLDNRFHSVIVVRILTLCCHITRPLLQKVHVFVPFAWRIGRLALDYLCRRPAVYLFLCLVGLEFS